MLVLCLESSCDETAAAVVRDGRSVLSSVVASQVDIHARYGGVVPELASRSHLEAVVPVVETALEQAGVTLAAIEGLAVTRGPGLIGALLVGLSAAKAIAFARDLPLVGVHHIEGHILAIQLEQPVAYPYLALAVSGGHTHLYRVDGIGQYRTLGRTIDDAAGEAFDKVGKLMGLGYPGGARIDALAAQGNPTAVHFPRPLLHKRGFDFSFSGIKTAVLHYLQQQPPLDEADPCRYRRQLPGGDGRGSDPQDLCCGRSGRSGADRRRRRRGLQPRAAAGHAGGGRRPRAERHLSEPGPLRRQCGDARRGWQPPTGRRADTMPWISTRLPAGPLTGSPPAPPADDWGSIMWRSWGVIRRVKLQFLRFARLSGSPDDIAKGMALGIFIGMTPTFGFQMAIAVFCAWLLRENKIAAAVGVWITNPLTAPFIYALEYETGRVLLSMEKLHLPGTLSFAALRSLGGRWWFPSASAASSMRWSPAPWPTP